MNFVIFLYNLHYSIEIITIYVTRFLYMIILKIKSIFVFICFCWRLRNGLKEWIKINYLNVNSDDFKAIIKNINKCLLCNNEIKQVWIKFKHQIMKWISFLEKIGNLDRTVVSYNYKSCFVLKILNGVNLALCETLQI